MLELKVHSFSHCQNTPNMQYTENGYIFRGCNCTIFASLISRDQLLKGRICSSKGKK